jgi:hypothetical protein
MRGEKGRGEKRREEERRGENRYCVCDLTWCFSLIEFDLFAVALFPPLGFL